MIQALLRRLLPALVALPLMVGAAERATDFGDYTVHHSMVPTIRLTPEIAANYGLSRTLAQGLLTISVNRERDTVPAIVRVDAVGEDQRRRPVSMQEVREGDSVYYIGTFNAADGERMTFEIEVTPRNETPTNAPFELRYRGDYFIR